MGLLRETQAGIISRYDPFMWGRVIIGAVVIVLVAVWLAAIWILFADPRVLPWKWWMPKEISFEFNLPLRSRSAGGVPLGV